MKNVVEEAQQQQQQEEEKDHLTNITTHVSILILHRSKSERSKLRKRIQTLCAKQEVETDIATSAMPQGSLADIQEFMKSMESTKQFDLIFVDTCVESLTNVKEIVMVGRHSLPDSGFILVADEAASAITARDAELMQTITCQIPAKPRDADLMAVFTTQESTQDLGWKLVRSALNENGKEKKKKKKGFKKKVKREVK